MNSQTNDYKKFFIKTLGCKVNQYESEVIREALIRSGFYECLAEDIADVYIINTCTVTNRADRSSRHWIGIYHKMNPKAKIVVTGCYAENNVDNISFLPGVSNIVKNNDKNRIADILNDSQPSNTQYSIPNTQYPTMITDFKGHSKAFVKIQDGCENFCSYCAVPFVRGPLESRPIKEIVEEVKILTGNGFKEIVLTGICLGAWGKELSSTVIAKEIGMKGLGLVDVLKELDRISGDFRIRLSSIEPLYVTDELIDYIAVNKRICPHLHIPLQSGDDEILKKMNRFYTRNEYKALVDKAREKIDKIAITTDILIGYPGETETNFKNTVNFVKEFLPSRIHIFTFSKRKGTAAYETPQDIPNDILKKRFYVLKTAALSASYLYRINFLISKLRVLVETKRDHDTGLLTGYSDNYIKVLFQGPDDLMRKIVSVKINEVSLVHTFGEYEPR